MDSSCDSTGIVDRVTRPGISVDEVTTTYKTWALTYDQDIEKYGRRTPEETVSSVTRLEMKKDCKILDLAAGTGIAAEKLKENGFTNIDAYDASPEMLEIAKAKNIYQNIYCQFIGANKSEGIADDTYDVIVCVGAFYPGHLDQTCLPEIFRMLKKSGRFYFTRACHREPGVIEEAIMKMEKDGFLKIFEQRLVKNIHSHGDGYVFVLQKC